MAIPRTLAICLAACVSLTTASTSSPARGQHCQRRYLHGLDVNSFPTAPLFEGMFVKFESGESIAFLHESRDLLAIIHTDGSWEISNWNGYKGELKRNARTELCEYFDPVEDKYIGLPTKDVQFKCAPPRIHQCSTNEFMFEASHFAVPESFADEIFTLESKMSNNGRPVYRSQSGLFLFHTHQGWQVADGLHSDPILFAPSNASSPAFISAKWKERVHHELKASIGLHLACQPRLESKTCDAHEPCLNNSMCHSYDNRKFCLCASGFTGAKCSEKLPVCPEIPGTGVAYPTLTTRHYPGDIITVKCEAGMTKPFVQISCYRNARGHATWSDDVTCAAPAIQAMVVDDPPSSHGTASKGMSTILVLCVLSAVSFWMRLL